MDAAIGELKKALLKVCDLDEARARSEDTHGIHAHSNRRDRTDRRRARAFNRAVTAFGKAIEAATLGFVQAIARERNLPTATSKQWRYAAAEVGSPARAYAPYQLSCQLKEAGLDPAGLTDVQMNVLNDVETAWSRRRAEGSSSVSAPMRVA